MRREAEQDGAATREASTAAVVAGRKLEKAGLGE